METMKEQRRISLEQFTLFAEWVIANKPDTVFDRDQPMS